MRNTVRHWRDTAPRTLASLLIGIALAIAHAPTGRAQSTQRELVYQIAYGNVTLGVATIVLSTALTDYRIRLHSVSQGPLSIFARWHNEGETTGGRSSHGLHVTRHERSSDWGGDHSLLRMTIDDEGTLHISSDPPENPAKTALLLKRAGPRFLDPYSAVLALLYEIERHGTCRGTVRVFDGRRLTDMEIVAARATDLPRDRPWAYRGASRACRLMTRPIGIEGHDKRKGHELAIWITSGTASPPIPVRVELPLLLGSVVARLVPPPR